jgi:DNA repair protein RecN (Recombination protein N)
MLNTLYIENYILIERLQIHFDSGFSVITGETGAGKSIIVGALGLILGQRTDPKSIREGALKCVIEGTFSIATYHLQAFFEANDIDYDDHAILRREIYATGKSRAFINDTPVNLQQLKEIGEKLIDIHSQHQNLLLQHNAFQLNIVDSVAQHEALLNAYQTAFSAYRQTKKQWADLREQMEKEQTERDYILYQWTQLNEAELTDHEQEQLEQEQEILQHAAEIKHDLEHAIQLLDGTEPSVNQSAQEVLSSLRNAARLFPPVKELNDRFESIIIDLKDIAAELNKKQQSIEIDPIRLQQIEQRLELLYRLEQKHHVTSVNELIRLRESFAQKMNQMDAYGDDLEKLQQEQDRLLREVERLGNQLSDERQKVFQPIIQHVEKQLKQLGMKHVVFQIDHQRLPEWGAMGNDEIAFLFSSNAQIKPQPVAQIASGGEISRVMLSLKSIIAHTKSLPSIIFDEIDMGISGEVANAMSLIMKQMGDAMQVISITHLPQIAARGKHHFKVSKVHHDDISETTIVQLNNEERINEIAGMLSGASITHAAIENAKQLLTDGSF